MITNKNKYVISVPYIYPVCPLSIDHAKIMLVADINARMQRKENKQVIFPIAVHYSGVTAQKSIDNLHSDDTEIRNKERDKFIKGYKTPRNVVEGFKNPEMLLDYYTAQTVMDLKNLGVSCDYNNFYKTNDEDYEIFVNTIFKNYEDKGLLINNSNGELALDYENSKWRNKTKKDFDKLEFISPSIRNSITSAFDNIKSEWGILRDYGIGVRYNEKYVIDPMFDSELFVIYDLYKRFEKLNNESNSKKLFKEIFEILAGNKKSTDTHNPTVKNIIKSMPTDLFVCEEHLKNWIVKKTYSENALFSKKYQTKTYFITGMGYIDGKRMSSSRGTAVLLKDLLEEYGGTVTRMIIMFTGGHPSKMYNYSQENIVIIQKMLSEFYNYINYINAAIIDEEKTNKFSDDFDYLNKLLKEGYYQQLLVEILKNIPKKCYNMPHEELVGVKNTISYFIDILIPDLKI